MQAVAILEKAKGASVNSAHLVEFTDRNDVADLLRSLAAALP